MFDWLIKWLIDWQTDEVTNWLTDWLNDWRTNQLTDWLTDLLTDWLSDWGTTDRLSDWLTHWLAEWLIDWLSDWVTFLLTDRLRNIFHSFVPMCNDLRKVIDKYVEGYAGSDLSRPITEDTWQKCTLTRHTCTDWRWDTCRIAWWDWGRGASTGWSTHYKTSAL